MVCTRSRSSHEFDEFHEVCSWLQTSPDSRFTGGSIVSLARENGRVSLAGTRLITTDGEDRTERDVGADEMGAILRREFGIVLP